MLMQSKATANAFIMSQKISVKFTIRFIRSNIS